MKKLTFGIVFALIFAILAATSVYADNEYIETKGTPFCTVDTPLGGGSKDINIINDGITDSSNGQYDTFIQGVEPHEIAFGYMFDTSYVIKQVEFTEGGHFHDGGWYANGDIKVQAFVGDKWVDVESMEVTPEYPDSDLIEDFGDEYETYVFTFDPIECTGIQVFGTAGGSATFASCAELKVLTGIIVVEEEIVVEEPIEESVQESAEIAEPTPVTTTTTAPQTSDASIVILLAVLAASGVALVKTKKTK